jgi:hypothetical protein
MVDPAAFAQCAGTPDVIAAVRFARKHDVPFSIKAGGHNVAGNALVDRGLVIDLSPMRAVEVNRATKTARVQGGATWADARGGLGWLMRKYGMSVDLKSVEMVNARAASSPRAKARTPTCSGPCAAPGITSAS